MTTLRPMNAAEKLSFAMLDMTQSFRRFHEALLVAELREELDQYGTDEMALGA